MNWFDHILINYRLDVEQYMPKKEYFFLSKERRPADKTITMQNMVTVKKLI